MDLNKITDIKFDGIDWSDCPDFCDAFITSANYIENGVSRELTKQECEDLLVTNPIWAYKKLWSVLI